MFQLCACHSDTPQYNSSETFRNVPLLLSHVCLCAVRFDGYDRIPPPLDLASENQAADGAIIEFDIFCYCCTEFVFGLVIVASKIFLFDRGEK